MQISLLKRDSASRRWSEAVLLLLALAGGGVMPGCASPEPTAAPASVPAPTPAPPPPAAAAATGRTADVPRVETPRGPLGPREAARVIQREQAGNASDLLSRHLAAVERMVEAPLTTGNSARVLVDGPATHKAMMTAIEAAADHVNLGTYIFESDAIGHSVAALLQRKRAQGVRVNVMVDGVGSLSTPAEFFESLRKADVAVCVFNPVSPLRASLLRVNNRNHRKILVVDGRVGFTGGINISGVYTSSSFGSGGGESPEKDGWRDTHVEVRGPVVADLQRLFLEPWRAQCGEPPAAKYFPGIPAAGDKVMRVIAGDPQHNEVYAEIVSAIERAGLRIALTMGYFVPDPRLMSALTGAARRGVDVRLALPGVSDFWAPLYAGRSHYDELLAAGVRIWERRDAMLHAKTAVVDGVWSTIGSTNLDWRSFVHNLEANVVVLGVDFGENMDRLFARDAAASVEITAGQWAERPVLERLREWAARRWEYWL